MILFLDHKIFGNGFGMKSPHCDNRFYWLNGELYTFSYGLGAQLTSIQWTHPIPGEKRVLCGRKFRPFISRRTWFRVIVYWCMDELSTDSDKAHVQIRELESDLGKML